MPYVAVRDLYIFESPITLNPAFEMIAAGEMIGLIFPAGQRLPV